MKLTNMQCPNCCAAIQVDADSNTVTCEYCNSSFVVGGMSSSPQTSHISQEEAGYQFEMGRQRAMAEAQSAAGYAQYEPPKKRRTWLWVLGWIFIFPVPLTILMIRSKRTANINIYARIAIVGFAWLLFFALAAAGDDEQTTEVDASAEVKQEAVAGPDETSADSQAADSSNAL